MTQLVRETRVLLARSFDLPHHVAVVGVNLFTLLHERCGEVEPEIAELLSEFRAKLSAAGFDDIVTRQMNYAIRLANWPGELIYEEVHKLFSLCDAVHELSELGLAVDAGLKSEFEQAVRARSSRQARAMRLAAEDRVNDQNRERWWYVEAVN